MVNVSFSCHWTQTFHRFVNCMEIIGREKLVTRAAEVHRLRSQRQPPIARQMTRMTTIPKLPSCPPLPRLSLCLFSCLTISPNEPYSGCNARFPLEGRKIGVCANVPERITVLGIGTSYLLFSNAMLCCIVDNYVSLNY